MPRSIGYLGVTDLFTVINLLGGVLGIYFAMTGRIEYAGYAVIAGWLAGDVLEQQLARWTGADGDQVDSAAAYMSQGVAPAVILYKAYELGGQTTMGLILMGVVVAIASIHQARFATAPFQYAPCHAGLPRAASGLVILSLPGSQLFFHWQPHHWQVGAAIVGLVSLLNLLPIAYPSAEAGRLRGRLRYLVVPLIVAPPLLFAVPSARPFVYDFILVCALGYALASWVLVLPEERRAFREEHKQWAVQVARR